jgi:hypothetical protein
MLDPPVTGRNSTPTEVGDCFVSRYFLRHFLDCLSHRKNKIRGFALLSIFLQLIMRMPMMDVGIVHMRVSQLAVVVDVRVRLTWRIAWLVQVLMMLVVPVSGGKISAGSCGANVPQR